ncbi:fibrinogen-like protein A isoform X2 [Apostichopus japonicus]|uniref:fibrinogen-like protein A isoform X2 n=1 Tax=Stichopus japonicus TaxID=307972 RepID=UPI003AB819EE
MEKGGLKQCRSPFLIHLLIAVILLLGGRSQASESVQETTPMQTTTGDDPSIVMKDCLDVFNAGHTTNGIYTIKPTNWTRDSFDVFCNMTDGGGWTVFQRRVDGSVDFYRNWTSYKEGFGELDHEFWLGNDKLYDLTNQGDYQLRIDLVNKDGAPYYAKFDLFRINDESDNYTLSGLEAYSGTADIQGGDPGGHALSSHLNSAFSTFDRDNDKSNSVHCAVRRHGAWWYKSCAASNLNGDYMAADDDASSIHWQELPGGEYNIKYTEMKIRPV